MRCKHTSTHIETEGEYYEDYHRILTVCDNCNETVNYTTEEHDWVYTIEPAADPNYHLDVWRCSGCPAANGGDWAEHDYDENGYCETCDYQGCSHDAWGGMVTESCDEYCIYKAFCEDCGTQLSFIKTEHNGEPCDQCGFEGEQPCTHQNVSQSWLSYSDTQHITGDYCYECEKFVNPIYEDHYFGSDPDSYYYYCPACEYLGD